MKKEELPATPEKIADEAELKILLKKNLEMAQKNLELSEDILTRVKYIRRYVFWKKVMSAILWILIILSTIISLLYLPAWIKDLQSQIQTMITPGLIGF
jgi:hypothetical protein